MNFPEVIGRKRDGGATSPEELAAMIAGLLDGSIPEYQVSAWLMAVVFRGMERAETAAFTRLMMESGDVLDFSDLPDTMVDKHSTGGVGDKITIPLAPAAAAAGARVPMISGRGLGHTGGTLDKLESIPGLRTDLDAARFREVLASEGFSIISAGARLAPADGRLYALRDVTGTVPSIPLITASILSKKYAAGVDALVLDVKCGSGAFMREREDAVKLARTLVDVSTEMGKSARALVTTMDAPLGAAVGNALEVRESIDVLSGGGPADVRELTVSLGAEMLVLAGISGDADDGAARIREQLDGGAARECFARWIAAQGGDAGVVERPDALPSAPVVHVLEAPRDGYLTAIDSYAVGLAANALGAGRNRVGDAVDPAVGFVFRAKPPAHVAAGDPLVEIHARSVDAARGAEQRLLACMEIGEEAPRVASLVLERIGKTNGAD
ncbi:thymidine phosphorylase [bacterium]|nr:thymidine phosphorylase [bacterium]